MILIKEFISIGQIPKPVHGFAMHTHNAWELKYYFHGNGIVQVGKCQYKFEKGDIFLLPPGISHSENSEDGFRNFFMQVRHAAHVQCENDIFRVHDTEGTDVFNIFQLIYRTLHMKPGNWPRIIQGLFDALNEYLMVLAGAERKSHYVETLENILVDNISNLSFRLDDKMESLGVSKDYLRRLFKKHTGLPPLEYLTAKRIEYAKMLMEGNHNSLKIKDIAEMSGFESPYYFSRVFRNSTGKSPKQWIKEICSGNII